MRTHRLSSAQTLALCDELRTHVGEDGVAVGNDERRRHGTDESLHPPAPPDIVVYPSSTAAAISVVRACATAGAPIIPFGAGTSLEGQIGAVEGGVCIDMARMNKILRLSVDDFDVRVQAGVTRTQLDAYLRPEGVFFPVDPGADATIGGMIGTRATGTMTVRYGGMVANVVSMTVITASGELVRTASRARKTAAGYDLTRLFIGSEGTLGLICDATLRVHPTPEVISSAVCAFPDLEAAVRCAMVVMQTGVPVARLELVDETQVEASNRYDGTDRRAAPTLFLEFHGDQTAVQTQAHEVKQIAHAHGALDFAKSSNSTEHAALWRARHRAYDAARALRPGAKGLVTDACVPLSALLECVTDARARIVELGLTAPIVGHVGDGNFHAQVLVDPTDPEELDRAEAFRSYVAERAIALGGTCTGEHGVGYGKARYLEQEYGSGGVALMQAIKRALDPDDVFNPGKNADAATRLHRTDT